MMTASDARELPLLSVITVVRNDAARLAETAASVGAQEPAPFEWIVVDGASTDGTGEVIAANRGLIAASLSEPDRGIFDAMGKGVALASGRFVHFLNAGDRFAGADCAAHICAAIARSDVDVLVFAAIDVFAGGMVALRHPAPVAAIIGHRLPTGHQALVTRRSLMRSHGFDLRFRVCADYGALAAQYAAGARCETVDRAIVHYDRSPAAFSATNWHRMAVEHWQIQRDILRVGFARRVHSLAKRLLALLMVRALAKRSLARPAAALARRVYRA